MMKGWPYKMGTIVKETYELTVIFIFQRESTNFPCSQTCMKRLLLGQRKSGETGDLLKEVQLLI